MTRHDLFRYVVSWLYPNVCPCCDRAIFYNDAFCEDCFSELREYKGEYHVQNTDRFVSYCEYAEPASTAILKFKKKCEGNAYYAFAYCIKLALEREGLADSIDVITAVPVTDTVREARGYNQSELIADELKYMLGRPHINALKKIRSTAQQKHLNGEERRKNVLGAYAMKDGVSVEGKSVLIVDDVCTTGSTLSETSRVLRENGAKFVIAATFAKTVDHEREKEPV